MSELYLQRYIRYSNDLCILQVQKIMKKSMNQRNSDRGSLTTADKIVIGVFGLCFAVALFAWLSLL